MKVKKSITLNREEPQSQNTSPLTTPNETKMSGNKTSVVLNRDLKRKRYSMNYQSYESTAIKPKEEAKRMLDYVFPGYEVRDGKDWFNAACQTELTLLEMENKDKKKELETEFELFEEGRDEEDRRLKEIYSEEMERMRSIAPHGWVGPPLTVRMKIVDFLFVEITEVVKNPRLLTLNKAAIDDKTLEITIIPGPKFIPQIIMTISGIQVYPEGKHNLMVANQLLSKKPTILVAGMKGLKVKSGGIWRATPNATADEETRYFRFEDMVQGFNPLEGAQAPRRKIINLPDSWELPKMEVPLKPKEYRLNNYFEEYLLSEYDYENMKDVSAKGLAEIIPSQELQQLEPLKVIFEEEKKKLSSSGLKNYHPKQMRLSRKYSTKNVYNPLDFSKELRPKEKESFDSIPPELQIGGYSANIHVFESPEPGKHSIVNRITSSQELNTPTITQRRRYGKQKLKKPLFSHKSKTDSQMTDFSEKYGKPIQRTGRCSQTESIDLQKLTRKSADNFSHSPVSSKLRDISNENIITPRQKSIYDLEKLKKYQFIRGSFESITLDRLSSPVSTTLSNVQKKEDSIKITSKTNKSIPISGHDSMSQVDVSGLSNNCHTISSDTPSKTDHSPWRKTADESILDQGIVENKTISIRESTLKTLPNEIQKVLRPHIVFSKEITQSEFTSQKLQDTGFFDYVTPMQSFQQFDKSIQTEPLHLDGLEKLPSKESEALLRYGIFPDEIPSLDIKLKILRCAGLLMDENIIKSSQQLDKSIEMGLEKLPNEEYEKDTFSKISSLDVELETSEYGRKEIHKMDKFPVVDFSIVDHHKQANNLRPSNIPSREESKLVETKEEEEHNPVVKFAVSSTTNITEPEEMLSKEQTFADPLKEDEIYKNKHKATRRQSDIYMTRDLSKKPFSLFKPISLDPKNSLTEVQQQMSSMNTNSNNLTNSISEIHKLNTAASDLSIEKENRIKDFDKPAVNLTEKKGVAKQLQESLSETFLNEEHKEAKLLFRQNEDKKTARKHSTVEYSDNQAHITYSKQSFSEIDANAPLRTRSVIVEKFSYSQLIPPVDIQRNKSLEIGNYDKSITNDELSNNKKENILNSREIDRSNKHTSSTYTPPRTESKNFAFAEERGKQFTVSKPRLSKQENLYELQDNLPNVSTHHYSPMSSKALTHFQKLIEAKILPDEETRGNDSNQSSVPEVLKPHLKEKHKAYNKTKSTMDISALKHPLIDMDSTILDEASVRNDSFSEIKDESLVSKPDTDVSKRNDTTSILRNVSFARQILEVPKTLKRETILETERLKDTYLTGPSDSIIGSEENCQERHPSQKKVLPFPKKHTSIADALNVLEKEIGPIRNELESLHSKVWDLNDKEKVLSPLKESGSVQSQFAAQVIQRPVLGGENSRDFESTRSNSSIGTVANKKMHKRDKNKDTHNNNE